MVDGSNRSALKVTGLRSQGYLFLCFLPSQMTRGQDESKVTAQTLNDEVSVGRSVFHCHFLSPTVELWPLFVLRESEVDAESIV